MAGSCVERIKHDDPKCTSASKPLQIFLNDDNTFSGFCFHCHVLVKNPYGNNPPDPKDIHVKTDEEIEEEISDLKQCQKVPFKHRGLDPDDWSWFGVRVILNEADGRTPYAIAHPYTKNGKITGFKVKLIQRKTMWNVGDVRGADLYGWERAKRVGGTTLYITEGEEDAIALRKILRLQSSNTSYDYAVVSLPAGTLSVATCIGRMAGEINARFKDVVLAYDNDQPGQDAVKETRKILPHAKVAILPEKDANLCLTEGRLRATRDACVFNAAAPVATQVRHARQMMDEILAKPVWGATYPWEELTALTYGQRKGELISIGGGTGCGKTLIGHELAAWNAKEHKWRTLMIMMEETNAETFQSVAGKLDNIPYHVPVKPGQPDHPKDQLTATVNFLDEYITVWDIESIEDAETTWAQILHVIRTEGHLYDCIMVDNATTLSEGLDSSAKNDFLGKVMNEFAKMAKKFDFMAIMFSHLNAPGNGQRGHESGGRVQENQFTGSRAAMRYSHMIFGFERNKQAVNPHCSIFRCLKNRKFGKTGYFKTFYTERTGRLQARAWDDEDYKDAVVR